MKYNQYRRKTKKIAVGRNGTSRVFVGGDSPVSVQTMTNTSTSDKKSTLEQVKRMEAAGADIIRITVPKKEDASIFSFLHENGIKVPLVADIHFDYRIALECVSAGVDKIRINPGNIGDDDRIAQIVTACRINGIPIRIGVNSGSVERSILEKYGAPTADALADSALYHISLLERFDFEDIIAAVKSSDVKTMISAYRILAEKTNYPLHLGVTEAGTVSRGVVKSAAGIGSLLCDGIGDTIRISLTADPVQEIVEGRKLLNLLGVSDAGIDLVSCPTCGRTKIDLIALTEEFERRSSEIHTDKRLKVAIMGCAVNGPGESREADFGVACGEGEGLIFSHGEIIKKVPGDMIVDTLIAYCNGEVE